MNKKILYAFTLILFLFSFGLGNEIWEKEIPPSYYLENFALKNQKTSSKGIKYLSYGSFIGGIILGSVHTYTEAQIASGLITIGGLVGIIYDLTTDHETIAFKEYKKIKDIQDDIKKERLSYEALVFLAEKSTEHKKSANNNSGNSKMDPLTALATILILEGIKSKNPQLGLTPEEKLLNNYLEQSPINK